MTIHVARTSWHVRYNLAQEVPPLNILDAAVMTMDELVHWLGCNVCACDVLALADSLEHLRPGIGKAYRKEYRGGEMNDLDIAVMTRAEAVGYISSENWTPAFVKELRRIVVLRPDIPINYDPAAYGDVHSICLCIKPAHCSWCGRLKP